jgi:hypothetical protein
MSLNSNVTVPAGSAIAPRPSSRAASGRAALMGGR